MTTDKHKWMTKQKQPFPWTCACGFKAVNGNEVANHAKVNML